MKFGGEYEHGDIAGLLRERCQRHSSSTIKTRRTWRRAVRASISRRGTLPGSRFRRATRRRSATFLRSRRPTTSTRLLPGRLDRRTAPDAQPRGPLRPRGSARSRNDLTGLDDQTPHENDINNFQPRVGFAWDVTGTARTRRSRRRRPLLRPGLPERHVQPDPVQQRRAGGDDHLNNPTDDPAFANDPLGGRTFEDFKRLAGAINVARIADDASSRTCGPGRSALPTRSRGPGRQRRLCRPALGLDAAVDRLESVLLPPGRQRPAGRDRHVFPNWAAPVRARAARIRASTSSRTTCPAAARAITGSRSR